MIISIHCWPLLPSSLPVFLVRKIPIFMVSFYLYLFFVLCSIQTLQGRLSFIKYIQWMILICFIICIFLHFRKNWLIYYKDGKIIIFQAEPKLMYRVTIYWIFYWRIQWRFKKVFIIHNFETMGLIVISQIFCFFWYGLCNIVKAIHPAESVTSRKKFNECIF